MNNKVLNEVREIIKGGILYILSGSLLVKAITMISSIVVARLVDKSEYAYYTYANNLYQYVELIAGLGLSSAILVKCAAKPASGKTRGYIRKAMIIGCIVQTILSLALCVGISILEVPFPQIRKYVYMMILLPTFSYILLLFQSYSRVCFENRFYSLLGIIQSSIVCITGVIFTYYFSISGMVVARYIGLFATVLYGIIHYKKFIFSVIPEKISAIEQRDFLKLGISLVIANLFSSIMPSNEAFLVNNIIKDENIISNFKIAGLFPEQLLLLTGAMMVYYFPAIAKIDDPQKVWNKVKRIAGINLILIIICAVIGMMFTPVLIQVLYGEKYLDAVSVSYILWIMRAVNAGIRMVPMNILPAIGCTRFNALMAFFSCVIQTVLDYYLISKMGINGVAYATIFVYLISGLITWCFLYLVCQKRLKARKNENVSK